MYYRHNQFDVAHTLATHFLFGNFYPATIAHDAFVANTFVLAAITFVIFGWTKNLFAEQPIAFGFVRTVVDGFGFEDFPVTAIQNRIG